MRAFVTGVTGFAGSHLAEHLLTAGDTVVGCNRSGRWHEELPQDLQRGVRLIRGDIGQASFPTDVESTVRQFAPDVIYHLAAISIPAECGDQEPTAEALAINVHGTERVLQLAASLPNPPRVVFVSSAHVYPAATSDAPPVDESQPLAPRGAYGRTKALAEVACGVANSGTALDPQRVDVVVARAFPHAGPRQDERLMLAGWCRQFVADATRPIEVFSLDSIIDLSDVRDVVRAYRLLALHGSSGQAYNVGSGIRRTSAEVFAILQQLADANRAVVQLRPGVRFDPIANLARLASATGWQPTIPLEQTVADTLDEVRRRRVR